MTESVQKIDQYLKSILGPEKGYFGRVRTWGQTPNEYEQIGFVPTEDFEPMLSNMTDEQRKNLVMITTYFEIHTLPLKNLLNADDPEQLYKLYSEIAWSHFATVVMFGMLEVAVKGQKGLRLEKKGEKIKKFLEDNLPRRKMLRMMLSVDIQPKTFSSTQNTELLVRSSIICGEMCEAVSYMM